MLGPLTSSMVGAVPFTCSAFFGRLSLPNINTDPSPVNVGRNNYLPPPPLQIFFIRFLSPLSSVGCLHIPSIFLQLSVFLPFLIPKRYRDRLSRFFTPAFLLPSPPPTTLIFKDRQPPPPSHGVLKSVHCGWDCKPQLHLLPLHSKKSTISHCVNSAPGITERRRLSWLTNSALVYEPKCGRGLEGSQPLITAVNMEPI